MAHHHRHEPRPDPLAEKLRELQSKAFAAEMQQTWVEAREPIMHRVATELRDFNQQNGFTELFLNTVGRRHR